MDNRYQLYSTLADWWHLMSDPADYAEEAAHHWQVLTKYAARPLRSILELGSGGGNNASHLKRHARMTLVDLSPQMLAASRSLNPECEHIEGDMASLRLHGRAGQPGAASGQLRAFDAVFVHDAIMYMLDEASLGRVMQTAFTHCSPGGVALFVPDCTRETFVPSTGHGGHDGAGGRAMRYLNWTYDDDPADTKYSVDMVFLLREADGRTRVEHERHQFGLFPEATWLRLLREAGFTPHVEPCRYREGEAARSFVGVRT